MKWCIKTIHRKTSNSYYFLRLRTVDGVTNPLNCMKYRAAADATRFPSVASACAVVRKIDPLMCRNSTGAKIGMCSVMNKPYLPLEPYLVLFPDGSMRWIHCQHEDICSTFRKTIGCSCLEHVALPYGFGCVVDECGKIKSNPQPFNPYASVFYPGTLYGDPLVGPVIFVREGLHEGEWDWVPLQARDISMIELILGKKVPGYA